MAAQDLGADRVERAKPAQALRLVADQGGGALSHFAGGLVGEGHGEGLAGPCLALVEDMRQPGGQHAGLAGACARQHQKRAFRGLHRIQLLGVQPVQIGRIADIALWRSGHGALGNGQGVEFVFGHGGKALGPQVATGWRS